MSKYDDIMDLPHHISKKHPQMPITDRAAQFSPFAALTGYEAAVNEAARQTSERIRLDESAKAELDMKLSILKGKIAEQPQISVTYFVADEKKEGGSYAVLADALMGIDEYDSCLTLTDGLKIPTDDILKIESALFDGLL